MRLSRGLAAAVAGHAVFRPGGVALLCAALVPLTACDAGEKPQVLARFQGGVVTARELRLEAHPVGPDLRDWVEKRTVLRADREIVTALAGESGLIADPRLRSEARVTVAARLALQRVRRICPAAAEGDARVGRAWVAVRRILIRLSEDAGSDAEREATAVLGHVLAAHRAGEDFASLAKRHSQGPRAERGGLQRIYRDSAVAPEVLELAWSLPDGGVAGPLRTPQGVELLLRETSGIEPQPRLRRFSSRMEEALSELSDSICPSAVDALDTDPRSTAEELDAPDLAARVDLAFRLAAGQAPEPIRARLESEELSDLAIDRTLADERLRRVAAWPEAELRRHFEAHPERFGASFEESRRRVVEDLAGERASDLDAQWLAELRRRKGLRLDPEAIERLARTLGA